MRCSCYYWSCCTTPDDVFLCACCFVSVSCCVVRVAVQAAPWRGCSCGRRCHTLHVIVCCIFVVALPFGGHVCWLCPRAAAPADPAMLSPAPEAASQACVYGVGLVHQCYMFPSGVWVCSVCAGVLYCRLLWWCSMHFSIIARTSSSSEPSCTTHGPAVFLTVCSAWAHGSLVQAIHGDACDAYSCDNNITMMLLAMGCGGCSLSH